MDDTLPKHQREPRDKASKYWDGRYAQRHPNSIYSSEQTIAVVLGMLARATAALERWKGVAEPLPAAAADDLRQVFENLDDVTWHMPDVVLWCVWTEYLDGWSDNHVVWSAHLTEEAARAWLPQWQKSLGHRKDYGWHISLHPCKITDVRDPDARAEQFVS